MTAEQAEVALDYLQRALDRKADIFAMGLKETRRSLATLRRRGVTFRQANFASEANVWLDQHLTPAGRRAMLTAMRQGRAANRAEPSRTIRVSGDTYSKLSQLALNLGLSVPETVAHLAATAEIDSNSG